MKSYLIEDNEAGQRLDKYLKKLLTQAPDSFLYKMLRKKNITLNGKKCDGKEKLTKGDEVRLYLTDDTIASLRGGEAGTDAVSAYLSAYRELRDIDIVYENADILVVNKPAGALSQKAAPTDYSVNEWLIGYLLERGEVSEQSLATFKPSICNRLDRNTSGMVVCGKTLAGSQYMSAIIKDKSLAKYYTCIVQGEVRESRRIQGWLYKDTRTNKVTVYHTREEIPPAQRADAAAIDTAIRPLVTTPALTKLEILLYTGKTHQIRAHLASIGHPLAGDAKYGSAAFNRSLSRFRLRGQLLHACRLELPHTDDERFSGLSRLVLTCEEPAVFTQVLEGIG